MCLPSQMICWQLGWGGVVAGFVWAPHHTCVAPQPSLAVDPFLPAQSSSLKWWCGGMYVSSFPPCLATALHQLLIPDEIGLPGFNLPICVAQRTLSWETNSVPVLACVGRKRHNLSESRQKLLRSRGRVRGYQQQ